MADATDSKSVVRKGVWVRLPPRAQQNCGHNKIERIGKNGDRTLNTVSTTFSGRLIERRLLRGSQTLRQLREELRVVDEQLAVLTSDTQDKELRSLVSETPSAAFEHRDAQAHVDSLSRHREHLLREILDLELRQDSLLDKLGR